MNKKTLLALGVTVFAAGTSFAGNLVPSGERRSAEDAGDVLTPVAEDARTEDGVDTPVFSLATEVISALCDFAVFDDEDAAAEFYTSGMSKTVEVFTMNEIISRSDLVDTYGTPVTNPADCLYEVLCKSSGDGLKKLLVVTRSEYENKFDLTWELSSWLSEMRGLLLRAGVKVLVLNDAQDAWVIDLAIAKSITREAVVVASDFGTLGSVYVDGTCPYDSLDVFYDARSVEVIRASAAAGEIFGGNAALFNREA